MQTIHQAPGMVSMWFAYIKYYLFLERNSTTFPSRVPPRGRVPRCWKHVSSIKLLSQLPIFSSGTSVCLCPRPLKLRRPPAPSHHFPSILYCKLNCGAPRHMERELFQVACTSTNSCEAHHCLDPEGPLCSRRPFHCANLKKRLEISVSVVFLVVMDVLSAWTQH